MTTTTLVTGWRAPAPALAPLAQVSLDFENGSLGSPITGQRGAACSPTSAASGTYGCRLDPTTTPDHVAFLTVDRSGFALNKPFVTYSMVFRLMTAPSPNAGYMNLFEIGSSSTATVKSQFTAYFKQNRLVCDFDYSESLDLGPVPEIGRWHVIRAVIHYGATTYTAHVSVDNSDTVTLTSHDDKVPASVKTLWIHYPSTAVDYTMDVDEVKMTTSDVMPDLFPVSSTLVAAAPMTTGEVKPFHESFEYGAVGTEPTSSNTAYDQSIGDRGAGNGTVAATLAADGVRGNCARFYNTRVAAGTFGFLGKRVEPTALVYLRRYYKLDVHPVYRTSVLLYKFGGTGNGQLGGMHNGSFAFGGINQSRKFSLVNGDTVVSVSQATVPLSQWFRAEVELDFSTGIGKQTVRLFLGDNYNGIDADETLSAPLAGTFTEYIEDGILTNPNVLFDVKVDEVVNGTSWAGPVLL